MIHQDHEPSIRVDEDHKFAAKVKNEKITTIPFRVNPTMQVNLNKIGGILLHDTVKLPVTIDGFYQRMRRDFSVISRRAEESHGICQWNEDDSWR